MSIVKSVENQTPPQGWGNDPLTKYLDACRNNQQATFVNKRSEVIDLTTIDGMFGKLLNGALNPRPLLPVEFLQRAHSAFLVASGAVMSGQLSEVPALLRNCLEQGGYAHYIGDDQARWERWMDRHQHRTRTQQDEWRKEFTHGKVRRGIAAANADIGRAYTELYDRTIDYGAHPNERGATMGSAMQDTDDDGVRFETIYLHGDGLMLDFALRTTAQVGICVLQIAQLIYPARTQATGVQFQLETIARRF